MKPKKKTVIAEQRVMSFPNVFIGNPVSGSPIKDFGDDTSCQIASPATILGGQVGLFTRYLFGGLAMTVISIILCSSIGYAAGFLDKKVVKLGEAVPNFKLSDTSGKPHELNQYHGKFVMIHFWSSTCPFVIRYDERLKEITDDYANRGVVVLGIDSNSDEALDQIRKVAEKRKVNYPMLLDPGNKVADQFGAITTPHVFIIDQEGKLIYEGAVDNQGWSEANPVTQHYVRQALDAVLSGSAVPYPETKSVGCTVKRKF